MKKAIALLLAMGLLLFLTACGEKEEEKEVAAALQDTVWVHSTEIRGDVYSFSEVNENSGSFKNLVMFSTDTVYQSMCIGTFTVDAKNKTIVLSVTESVGADGNKETYDPPTTRNLSYTYEDKELSLFDGNMELKKNE